MQAATTAPIRSSQQHGRLDISSALERNLETRKQLEAFIEDKKRQVLEQKRQLQICRLETSQQVEETTTKHQLMHQQAQQAQQDCEQHMAQLQALQVEIEVLKNEKARKEPVVQQLLEQKQAKDSSLESYLQVKEQKKLEQQQQLRDLQKGVAMYQLLGLDFEQLDANKLFVKFSRLDPNDVNRVFSFCIRMHASADCFVVENCQPSVPTLQQFVDRLNADGDLSFFIRTMRKLFKQTLTS